VCIVPAQDHADYIAGLMLARLLDPQRFQALVLPKDILASEMAERVAKAGDCTVLVSAMPPSAASNAAYLARRLRGRFPERRIIVALWAARGSLERIAQRLKSSGASEVLTSFHDAVAQARLVTRAEAG
jgi:hypothetical protein